jgi:flagellin
VVTAQDIRNGVDVTHTAQIAYFFTLLPGYTTDYMCGLMPPDYTSWAIFTRSSGASNTISLTVMGSNSTEVSAMESALGMSGATVSAQGTDAVQTPATPDTPAVPSTVTIADGSGNSVDVTVDDSDTSFAGTGYFSGLTVNLAGANTLADLDGGSASSISFDAVTTGGTPSVVGSVSFGSSLGSKITNGANLTFTYSAGNVTISNGAPADDQTIAVNAADTSFTVSSGNYSGMTVNLASGKTVSDLTSGTDGVLISISAGSSGITSSENVTGIDVSNANAASAAITTIRSAINTVSNQRAYIGAMENRLNYKLDNLSTASQNLSEANSRIRDVDIAKEMTEYTKRNILMQAATAMLAQANQAPQQVLSLLK